RPGQPRPSPSLRKLTQRMTPPLHDLARQLQLLGLCRVVRRDTVSTGRGRCRQRIALFDVEVGQQLLGQGDAQRIADLDDFEREMHGRTCSYRSYNNRIVITLVRTRQGKFGRKRAPSSGEQVRETKS